MTGSILPRLRNGSGSATLNLTASATATTGGYTITITGTSGSLTHSAAANLLVLSSSGPALVSIALTPGNSSIAAGGTQQYIATGIYSDSSTQNLTGSVIWTSSSAAAATISAAGLATTVAPGSATIQAASGAISGSATLTVTGTLSGLVGHWTFDEGSGTTAADSSGNGYTATLVNGVTWLPGKLGNAISANNTNQYAKTPSIDLSATSAVTVAAWVNRTYSSGGTNGDTLFEFSDNYNNYSNVFAFFPDEAPDCGVTAMEIGIDGNSGYNIKCFSQPTSGVWHHLAVVYDMSQAAASEVNLYIDGALQTALSQTYNSNNSGKFGNYPLYLFSRAGTTSFSGGEMDDLQLFNRALSASEVQQVFNGSTSTPAADFALGSVPGSQTVLQGGLTAYNAVVAAANGFSGSVALSVSGLPTGATGTFSPTSISGSGASALTVATSATTPGGTYTLTITGSSGTLTHSTTTTTVVNAPVVPDFTLGSSPGTQTVVQGAGTTYTGSVTAVNGFSGSVALSVSGLPTGATGTFGTSPVTGSGTSTLTITTLSTTPTGTYTLTITGTSGTLSHSATSTLVVSSPATTFTMTETPASRTIAQGKSTTYSATMTTKTGFSGAVTFSLTGLPTGATATFSPASRTSTGSTTLTVATTASSPVGTYHLTITGTNGSQSQSVAATLILTGSFTVAISPAAKTITAGTAAVYTVTATAGAGFTGTETFTISGLPSGATSAFSPTSVAGSGTSTLTVTTTSSTRKKTYTLTITGTSGSITSKATATMTVQ